MKTRSDEIEGGGCAAPPCSASSDLRTRAGRRKEIIDKIQRHRGFSIFWVTDNHLRAVVAEEMERAGEIVTDNKTHGFPWLGAKILKQNSIYSYPPENDIKPPNP
jgi:hypothetical protein